MTICLTQHRRGRDSARAYYMTFVVRLVPGVIVMLPCVRLGKISIFKLTPALLKGSYITGRRKCHPDCFIKFMTFGSVIYESG